MLCWAGSNDVGLEASRALLLVKVTLEAWGGSGDCLVEVLERRFCLVGEER